MATKKSRASRPKALPPASAGLTITQTDEGLQVIAGGKDRVWFSMDCKIQLQQYEPVGVGAGMSSDVSPGETADAAMDRVQQFVMGRVSEQRNDLMMLRDGVHPSQQQKTQKRGKQ